MDNHSAEQLRVYDRYLRRKRAALLVVFVTAALSAL